MHKNFRLALLLLLVTASPAVAQEGGLLDINEGLMVWTVLIFLLVLGILYKAAFPHILGAVEAREAKIRDLLEQAARDRDEAKAALEEQNKELADTRSRVQELVAEGKASGERVRDDMIADGRRQAEELMSRVRRDARQEMENALEELRVEAVEIALAAASKLIERNLDQEDNRRLVQEFLADIEMGSAKTPIGA